MHPEAGGSCATPDPNSRSLRSYATAAAASGSIHMNHSVHCSSRTLCSRAFPQGKRVDHTIDDDSIIKEIGVPPLLRLHTLATTVAAVATTRNHWFLAQANLSLMSILSDSRELEERESITPSVDSLQSTGIVFLLSFTSKPPQLCTAASNHESKLLTTFPSALMPFALIVIFH